MKGCNLTLSSGLLDLITKTLNLVNDDDQTQLLILAEARSCLCASAWSRRGHREERDDFRLRLTLRGKYAGSHRTCPQIRQGSEDQAITSRRRLWFGLF